MSESQPDQPDKTQPKSVKVTGLFCFVELSDGSIRQALTSAPEHDKTIMNVLQMNPQRALRLSEEDYSEKLEVAETTVDPAP